MILRRLLPVLQRLGRPSCLVLFAVALLYILVLPLPELSRPTYISENALMPDYAAGHYSPEFKSELAEIGRQLGQASGPAELAQVVLGHLEDICGRTRADVYKSTAYGIFPAERSDGNEGLVFGAPFRTISGDLNRCGIAYVLAAAKQYRMYKFWARDLVLLFPGIGKPTHNEVVEAVEDWLDAYHRVGAGVSLFGGALQAGIFMEMHGQDCAAPFEDAEIYLEGPNGLLPNLDLPNAIVMIERHRAGNMRVLSKDSVWHRLWRLAPADYAKSVVHAVGMLCRQAFGYPNYAHGPLLKYSIDAVTIAYRAVPKGKESEYADRNLFEVPELALRSLNNILEHLHQSFFFYVLPGSEQYVSIANYIAIGALPIAALLVSFVLGPFDSIPSAAIATSSSIAASVLGTWGFSRLSSPVVRLLALNLPSLLVLLLPPPPPKSQSSLRPLICLLGALSLIALIFLNFGLAVILGLFYGPWLVMARRHWAWTSLAVGISPATLFSVLLCFRHPHALFLARQLDTWNAGIPFFVWQPLLLLSATCPYDSMTGTTTTTPQHVKHD